MATLVLPKGYWTGTGSMTVDTWKHWNSTTTTGSSNPWLIWTGNHTSGTTLDLRYDPGYTWQRWEEDYEQPYAYRQPQYVAPVVREPTQDELDAAQRRREEASARALAARTRLEGAEDRALGLLRTLLTPDQIATMDADGEIWLRGSAGGLYIIETRDGRIHGNIRSVDEHGCMLGRLCVQPGMWDDAEEAALPTSDGYVGQLLAIRFNEPALLEKANWSNIRRCQEQRAA